MVQQNDRSTNTGQLFMRLYQTAFPAVAGYVGRRGGTFDEAKDVFQDAVMIYYEKQIVTGKQTENEGAYLMGIAKHLWLKSYHEHQRYIPVDEFAELANLADQPVQQASANKLLAYLETAGQKCVDLLKNFYYDQLSMQEIAHTFGFSGERSATVQKFKCLEKVRETVKQQSLSYEDFIE